MNDFKISHIAIWVNDIEKIREFYVKYFNCSSNQMYENTQKGFKSYFLTFGNSKIEIMSKTDITEKYETGLGYAHVAISVGSKENVDNLTAKLKSDGFKTTEPRTTGDGFYESTVLDPENNVVEITV